MTEPDNHNSGQYLAVVDQTGVRFARRSGQESAPLAPGWYVIRTCPCHERRPVTRRYTSREEAEAAAATMIAVSMTLGT